MLNRAVGRMVMFRREGDFAAFERTMQEAHELHPIRILSYRFSLPGRLSVDGTGLSW